MPRVSCALWATWTTFTSWRAPLLLGEWLHRQTLHLEERPLWKDLGWHQRDGVKCFQWHFPILPPIFGAMVPMVPMVPPFLAGSQHETSRSFSGHTGTSWADVHLVRSNAARNSFEILRWLKMMFLWFLYHNYYIFSPHPISVCIFLHYLFENTCWTKWIAMGSIVMRPFRGNSLCIHEGQPWGRKSPWSWEFKGLLTGESLKHQNYGFGKADPVGLLLGRVTWPDQWSSAQSVTMWEFGKWWLIIGITDVRKGYRPQSPVGYLATDGSCPKYSPVKCPTVFFWKPPTPPPLALSNMMGPAFWVITETTRRQASFGPPSSLPTASTSWRRRRTAPRVRSGRMEGWVKWDGVCFLGPFEVFEYMDIEWYRHMRAHTHTHI